MALEPASRHQSQLRISKLPTGGCAVANSPAVISKASPAPLTAGNPLPNPAIHKVANTTIETYFQNTFTCLDCHTQAAIASPVTPKKMASDYSFLFGKADTPAR
jgi:hypothetical protein